MGTATRPAALHLRGEASIEFASAASQWEWRVFARGVLPLHQADLPALSKPEAPVQDIHLLSARSEHIVLVRGRELQLQRLEQTAPGGLELWTRAFRTDFPITSRVLRVVCDSWGLRPPAQLRPTYGVADFEREILGHGALYAVAVTKRRTRLELMRCEGERVELVVGGERWETIAFRDPDPVRLRAVVNHLGLSHYANVNYSSALRRIVGFVPEYSQRA